VVAVSLVITPTLSAPTNLNELHVVF
jgi:hypothetical protein